MDLDNENNLTELDLPKKVLKIAMRNGLETYLVAEPLVVGVSGGPDSLALLHMLRSLRSATASQTIHVAHLDHMLRGRASEEDARFVAELAKEWGLPYTIRRFDVKQYAHKQQLSIEEAARNARYAFLAALAHEQAAAVAVAHNADDQVETVLMHILRGSGISGLRGMRMLTTVLVASLDSNLSELAHNLPTEPITLFRPLLGVWRREIEAYCAHAGLQPRLDITNTDRQYKRNRIRYELIPLLERDYDPAVKAHLHNLAELAEGEDEIIEALMEQEARRLVYLEAEGIIRFEQSDVADMPEALRLRLIRWAIKHVAGTLEGFTHRHIEEAAGIVSGEADSPRAADLPHGLIVERLDGWSVISQRRFVEGPKEQDISKWPIMDRDEELSLVPGDTLQLQTGWKLNSHIVSAENEKSAPGDLLALFDMDEMETLGPLVLRTRRPGDFMKPLGMKGSKTLQDLFIDAKIPRSIRDRIPLVSCSASGGEVLWVPGPGGRRSAHAPIGPYTRRVLCLEFARELGKEVEK
jgi:tRNA(Ile)-lysidine synthase